jgi:hypothetical protein
MIENQAFENRDINRTLVFINGLERINLLEIKLESNFTFDIESRVNFLFSASKNSGYLVPSDKQYYIKRFDIDKKAFAGEIEKKDFQRIKYTEMEIAEINDKFKKMRENNPILQNINLKMPVLKPAIKQIYADENENLYIISPTNHEGQYSLDLYDKSLKYRDSFLIPLTGLFYPTVDSIYLVIFDDKAGLQVYSLK